MMKFCLFIQFLSTNESIRNSERDFTKTNQIKQESKDSKRNDILSGTSGRETNKEKTNKAHIVKF